MLKCVRIATVNTDSGKLQINGVMTFDNNKNSKCEL